MTTNDPREARAYRRTVGGRLSRNIGLAAFIVATSGLINRDLLGTSSAGLALSGPVDTLWLLAYAAGGLAAFAGVEWRPRPLPDLEALGVWLLLGAMVINGACVIIVRGPVAGGITSIALFGLAQVFRARLEALELARQAAADTVAREDASGPELPANAERRRRPAERARPRP